MIFSKNDPAKNWELGFEPMLAWLHGPGWHHQFFPSLIQSIELLCIQVSSLFCSLWMRWYHFTLHYVWQSTLKMGNLIHVRYLLESQLYIFIVLTASIKVKVLAEKLSLRFGLLWSQSLQDSTQNSINGFYYVDEQSFKVNEDSSPGQAKVRYLTRQPNQALLCLAGK